MMPDAEKRLAEWLEGKFFWISGAREDSDNPQAVKEIRRVQRQFAGDAKSIFSNRESRVEEIEKNAPRKPGRLGPEGKIALPILTAIAKAYNLQIDDLLSKSTSPRLKKAKQHMCWALMKYLPKMSYNRAGSMIDKNHSTVLHGDKEFRKKIDREKVLEVERFMKCG